MKLVFTKQAGKLDRLEMIHADGRTELLDSPKQRSIPHAMVHHAVQTMLEARGFVRRGAAGGAARRTLAGKEEGAGVGGLVEAIQGDGWSGGTSPAADVID